MRIAVVSPFVDRRHGTERALAELLERLAREYGCEIHLYAQLVEDLDLTHSLSGMQPEKSGGIFWHRVPRIPGPHIAQFLGWMLLNSLLRRWHALARRSSFDLVLSPGINCLHPDVVIVHALFHRLRKLAAEENAGMLSFRRAHRRLYYRLLAALEQRIYRDPQVSLAAVSPRMAGLLKEFFARNDVSVIPNAVDTAHFSVASRLALRAEARQRRGFQGHDFVLLLIGNDWRVKGLPALLEALAQLPSIPWRLLVAGSDALEPFRQMASRLGVLDRCHWELPRPDVLDFYAAADLYVSTSLEDSFGLPVAEAMACALPVITSPHAGIAGFVRDGVDGFVLREPRDAHSLAQLIQRLQADPELCRNVGKEAASTAPEWTWDRNAAAVWELLKNAAKEKEKQKRLSPANERET